MDRNYPLKTFIVLAKESLSARRAWIEIPSSGWGFMLESVALRKESVDRNGSVPRLQRGHGASLSARRAWIEILPRELV